MTFSNPDYPVFLIAVFFLYGLSRLSDTRGAIARAAVMVLLGDVVFLLVAKDLDTLWDPIGGTLLRLATAGGDNTAWTDWPLVLAIKWPIGLAALAASIWIGRTRAGWIASTAGQRVIARGFAAILVAVGATVAIAELTHTLDDVTDTIVAYAHLVVLFVLGVGIGASIATSGASPAAEARRPLGRVIVLFVVSSLFYHAWAAAMPGPYRYLLALLLATIVLDYYLGIWIEETENPRARLALVIVSLCSNLGILCFFKYTDFFAQDVLHLPVRRLDLILPAGISFHTFQSLSYTIDVYRRKLRATRSVISFATFVLFFPQLVAGPIVRAQDLLPQLDDLPALELHKATLGVFRIVVGLFKKIALADTLGLAIVDRVFADPSHFSAIEVVAGVYGYALQIYLDFSAYSDIAIGSAEVLGFDLPENFRTPYRSANLQEFWRRWHISLSTWLRDYLYISLGGSRGTALRTYANLIITMLLGGLWHGARWTFIVWGALHGFGLAITRFFQRATGRDRREAWIVFGYCALIAVVGLSVHRFVLAGTGTWTQLVVAWLYITPLWAVTTAWLGGDRPDAPGPPPTLPVQVALRERPAPEILRILMCFSVLIFLSALANAETWTWIPLATLPWLLGIAADIVERGVRSDDLPALLVGVLRRAIAVALVFHYVCLAWIFFRAASFDEALGVLSQIALLETDSANLVPLLTTALAVGFMCHFFADGSFRWLRDRFVALPPWAQGVLLGGVALVLRELGHTKIVPFIYFQF